MASMHFLVLIILCSVIYFNDEVKAEGCGGIRVDDSGVITSPLYPSNYPPSQNCTWEIRTTPNKRIGVYFRSFALEGNCKYDSVTVKSKNIKTHGTFCGNQIPPAIISEENILLIEFRSDATSEYKGFSMDFYSVPNQCGGFVEKTSEDLDKVQSPLFMFSYPSNMNCTWYIQAPIKYNMRLNFTYFENEVSGKCDSDYVTVQSKLADGKVHEHGKFCNEKTPRFIYSKNNVLLVRFVSNGQLQYQGFMIEFYFEKYEVLIDGGHGNISTSFYPESYAPNEVYEWMFLVRPQHKLKLIFTQFQTEGGDNCSNDFLLIQGKTAEGEEREYGKYCGYSEPPSIYSQDSIVLTFVSDLSFQSKGFKAEYFIDKLTDYEVSTLMKSTVAKQYENNEGENVTATNIPSKECGGLIEGIHGYIYTPFYPDSYPPNTLCEWIFVVEPKHKLKIYFALFEIEGGDKNCSNDFLLIQGKTADGELHEHGKYCGSSKPPTIYSKDSIVLTFASDLSLQSKGFKAEYFIDDFTNYELSASLRESATTAYAPNESNVTEYENAGVETVSSIDEYESTTSFVITSTTSVYTPDDTTVENQQKEAEVCTCRNETNILSEALKLLTEKVHSIEDNQKMLVSNYENRLKILNGSSTSKNALLKDGGKSISSPTEKQLLNDCHKYIFFLRRMLGSEP